MSSTYFLKIHFISPTALKIPWKTQTKAFRCSPTPPLQRRLGTGPVWPRGFKHWSTTRRMTLRRCCFSMTPENAATPPVEGCLPSSKGRGSFREGGGLIADGVLGILVFMVVVFSFNFEDIGRSMDQLADGILSWPVVYHVIPYIYIYIYTYRWMHKQYIFSWYTWTYSTVFVVHFCVSKASFGGIPVKDRITSRFFPWIGHVEMNFVRRIVCSMPGSTEISWLFD